MQMKLLIKMEIKQKAVPSGTAVIASITSGDYTHPPQAKTNRIKIKNKPNGMNPGPKKPPKPSIKLLSGLSDINFTPLIFLSPLGSITLYEIVSYFGLGKRNFHLILI